MAQLLIRDITPDTLKRLKHRAQQHHRSLQGELKHIIEHAISTMTMQEMQELSQKWRQRLQGHHFTDSAAMLREDRNR